MQILFSIFSNLRFSMEARLRLPTADWPGLPLDILISILQKVRFIQDFLAFGSVCKSWKEAAGISMYLRPQIPWMISENNRLICRFWREEDVDPVDELRKKFPEDLKMHLDPDKKFLILVENNQLMQGLQRVEDAFDKECFGLNYGWIVTISRKGDMNLVHPLSPSRIELPNGNSIDNWLQNRETHEYISCAALSSNPSQTSDFALTIVKGGKRLCLRYKSLGDKRWTQTLNQMSRTVWKGLTYYQDRLYGVDYNGKVWGCGVSDPQDSILVTDLNLLAYEPFIVGSEGDLLVVVRMPSMCGFRGVECRLISDIKVYKLDLIKGGHKQIKSLGDKAIFIGHNTSTIYTTVSLNLEVD